MRKVIYYLITFSSCILRVYVFTNLIIIILKNIYLFYTLLYIILVRNNAFSCVIIDNTHLIHKYFALSTTIYKLRLKKIIII